MSKFQANVARIKRSGQVLDDMIHDAAVFAVYHSVKDGQVTPAIQLVAAMPKSSRRANLISWLAMYGNLTFNAKKGIFYTKQFEHSVENAQEQADIADETPFWEEFADAAVSLKPLDFAQKLKALLHSAQQAKTGESKKYSGLTHAELMAKVEELITAQ